MTCRLALLTMMAASPVMAASGPFFSLYNTDFVVAIALVIFIGIIIYFKAPQFAGKLIDGQIGEIRTQIDRAASLRAESAQSLEAARREAEESAKHAEQIIAQARDDARLHIEMAEARIRDVGERRLAAAREQMESAEKAALQAVRSEAINQAIEMAGKEIATQLSDRDHHRLNAQSLNEIREKIG